MQPNFMQPNLRNLNVNGSSGSGSIPKQKKVVAEVQMDDIDKKLDTVADEIASVMADEEASKPNQLLPKKVLQERYHKEIMKDFLDYRARLEKGCNVVVQSMIDLTAEDPEMFSTEVVEDINRLSGLSAIIDKDEDSFAQKLERGMTLQELAKVSNETVSKMYRAAKRLYDMKLFEEAASAFVFLTNINPEPHAFWKGLGNAEYCLARYEDALFSLEAAQEADPADPTCAMIISRCYLQLGNIQEALNAIERTLELAGDRPEYQHWKAGLEQERQRLQQKLHT